MEAHIAREKRRYMGFAYYYVKCRGTTFEFLVPKVIICEKWCSHVLQNTVERLLGAKEWCMCDPHVNTIGLPWTAVPSCPGGPRRAKKKILPYIFGIYFHATSSYTIWYHFGTFLTTFISCAGTSKKDIKRMSFLKKSFYTILLTTTYYSILLTILY